MKRLEFENTQGINLQYEVASLGERGLAFFIDFILLICYMVLMALITQPNQGSGMLYFLLVTIVFYFYSLMMEWLNDGRSVGKMIIGLKVIRIDGRPLRGYDVLMRWLFRSIDIYGTGGALGSLLIASTPRGQRLGDMLADTTVIQTRATRLGLKKVLSLGELRHHTPTFPQAEALTEEQVLLIKEVLTRYKRYKNQGTEEAMKVLYLRLKSTLGIDQSMPVKPFLETLMKDYIALTR